MKQSFSKFWGWYERHFLLNLGFASLLFLLQIFHLYWLSTDVVLNRLFGKSLFAFPPIWGTVSTFLDYSEIPALISTSILYISFLRKEFNHKYVWYLIALNIQWLHIFWITDEVVVERFGLGHSLFHWVTLVAWIAILIDYLELPVIFDTSKKLFLEMKDYLTKSKLRLP